MSASVLSLVNFPVSGRPRKESLYDTECYPSETWFYEGAQVDLVLWLGPLPYEWALIRRKHDRKRLVVHLNQLRRVPNMGQGFIHFFFQNIRSLYDPVIRDGLELRPLAPWGK